MRRWRVKARQRLAHDPEKCETARAISIMAAAAKALRCSKRLFIPQAVG
jgi:hypothetical protein